MIQFIGRYWMIFWMILPATIAAQPQKGLQLIEKGKFEEAYEALLLGLETEKDQPQSHYELADLFTRMEFSKYSLDSAYYHIQTAPAVFRKLTYKVRSKVAKRYSTSANSKRKRLIEERIFQTATEEGTLEAIQQALDKIKRPTPKQKRLAETHRNQLLFKQAIEIHQTDHYEAILQQHRKSLSYRTPKLYRQLQMRFFEASLSEMGWSNFDTLLQKYPRNPYSLDTAINSYLAIHESGDIQAYKAFAKSLPSSAFANLAIDSLYELVLKQEQLQEFEFFIYSYPNYRKIGDLWYAYYAKYKKQRPLLEDLESFQVKHTGFPNRAMIQADLEERIESTAQLLTQSKSNDFESYRTFLNIYGDRASTGPVWKIFLDLYLQEHRSLDGLERFEYVYRNFPYPDLLKAKKTEILNFEYQDVMASPYPYDAEMFIKNRKDYPLIDSVWLHWYQLEKKNDPKAFRTFRDKLAFPFQQMLRRDSANYEQEKELLGYEAIKYSMNTVDFIHFFKDFPASRFKPQLEKPYAKVLPSSFDPSAFYIFLETYPESPYKISLVKDLFLILERSGTYDDLRYFKSQFPDFDDLAKLDKALNIAKLEEKLTLNRSDPNFLKNHDAFIKSTAPSTKAYLALCNLIDRAIKFENWEKAGNTIISYKPYFGEEDTLFNQLFDFVLAPASKLEKINFSSSINTKAQEFEGVLSADGQQLYFTGRGRRDNLGGEDIYMSTKTQDKWSRPKRVPILSTKADNESVESLSTDGQEMILFKSGVLHQSKQGKEGWSKPIPLPDHLNVFSWQADARLTANGKGLLFSGQKTGGDLDIYIAFRDSTGNWGKPTNLGLTINTPETERSPFLAADMKTLYFSSSGHFGKGKLDVFVCERLDDTWTNWSYPRNLGRNINTNDHDWGYRIHTDGETVIYTLAKEENMDIYRLALPKDFKPSEVSTVTGLIYSKDTIGLAGTVTWTNLETGQQLNIQKSDPSTGSFFTILTQESLYDYTIQVDGYWPKSGHVDLSGGHDNLTVVEFLVKADEPDSKEAGFRMDNLFFNTASYEIKPESYPSLKILAAFIIKQKVKIEIHGHTDDIGSSADNMQLSQQRAQATKEYLVSQGCDPKLIEAKGFGETKPVSSENTEASKALNRRVEIKILN